MFDGAEVGQPLVVDMATQADQLVRRPGVEAGADQVTPRQRVHAGALVEAVEDDLACDAVVVHVTQPGVGVPAPIGERVALRRLHDLVAAALVLGHHRPALPLGREEGVELLEVL
jgi:hypothetical protein